VRALAPGWANELLRDVCIVSPREAPLASDAPFVPMDAVTVGERWPTYFEQLGTRSGMRAQDNDVLFARITPCLENGKLAQIPAGTGRLGGSTEFIVVRPGPRIDPAYLYYWCMEPSVRSEAKARMAGATGRMRLSAADLAQFPIPVPSLDEQRQIVDLLEDHLSRLDAANAGLASSGRRLAALKRSLLAELHAGPRLPLADLAWDSGYGTSEKCLADGPGVPVVRIPNLVNGLIDLTDQKSVADPAADVSGSMLADGDLLVVRTNGSVDLIGRSAVVQPGIDAAFASYLIRFRLREDLVRPGWAQAMLSTPQVRRTIEPLAASSAGQRNLSLSKLNPLQLPVPPLEQQDAALARLRAVDARIGSLRSDIHRGRAHSAALRRSLLAAAFSGRLTGAGTHAAEIDETICA
jgi:type I restriction enzyme S subunit